jgi:drug/metabolite transporter (DMT)-like permease
LPNLDLAAPLTVIAFALLAAGSWGFSDFGGGLLGRRSPVIGVLLVTQAIGCAIALAAIPIRGEAILAGKDLALTGLGGLLAAVGIGSLYWGLAVGRMGIVAPIAAVLAALTPATLGFMIEGIPSPIVLGGMAIAVVAVVIVSLSPGDRSDRPSGLGLALLAGVVLGLLAFTMSRVSSAYLFGPLAVMRLVQVVIFGLVILARRRRWRLPRTSWRLALGVAIVDLLGNAAYLTAARSGQLAMASVVSSLYPVVTVLLAVSILRERMTASHTAGVALAGVAIAMIAGGSAT